MNITWLGQAGFLFQTEGLNIIIDPYLSDSVASIVPQNKRRMPVDEKFLNIKPDVIVLTHNHMDHTDLQTLKHYITEESGVLVLASQNSWQSVRTIKGNNNYVLFNRHSEWTHKNASFKAVMAVHSDEHAIGIIMRAEGKCIYVTGDTLYNEEIFNDLPNDINYVCLPINGYGNNMNFADAKRFCEKIGAVAIPMHCGLFDNIDMHQFDYPKKLVPEIFKNIELK
ncbi:MAG: MBL fold metallo-hydrolase [Clostridia bacterium]|nr:MBL fold metallo-hydrolase [Clostridia bacterium]